MPLMGSGPRHQCHIYKGSPSRQLPALASVFKGKLGENYRCLYLNSPAMVAGMRSCLAAMDVDVIREVAKASLVLSSDQTHLLDGEFDVERMLSKLDDALNQALADGYTGLWAVGDMTWELGFNSGFDRLLEYEWRLEEFMREHPELCGICQYHADTLPREALKSGALSHQSFFINETLSQINPAYARPDAVTGASAANPQLDALIDQLSAFDPG